MPVKNFERMMIYAFECSDVLVNYVYVAATTELRRTKYRHKIKYNSNSTDELYVKMKEHGGWEAWPIKVLELYPDCKCLQDAMVRVAHWKTELSLKKSTLFHSNLQANHSQFTPESSLNCIGCKKAFTRKDNLKRHTAKCSEAQKQLIEPPPISHSHITTATHSNIHSNNNNQINNNQVNNNNQRLNITNNISYKVQLGNETVADALSNKQKHEILGKLHGCLKYYIHKIHFSGEYPECMNVVLTNLRSKYAHKYSELDQKFIAELAHDVFTEVIDTRFGEICDFYDDRKGTINKKMESRLDNFIDGMKSNPEKYKKAMDDVMLMAYNNKEKVEMENCANVPIAVPEQEQEQEQEQNKEN